MIKPLSPKILIVENQMVIAADIFLQCTKLGYQVIGITSRVEDALKIIEVNRPDIILMNNRNEGKNEWINVCTYYFK